MEKQSLNLSSADSIQESNFRPSTMYNEHIDKLSLPFIGKMVCRCVNLDEQKIRQNRNQIIRATVPSLINLKLNILQRQTLKEDNDEVWYHLTYTK